MRLPPALCIPTILLCAGVAIAHTPGGPIDNPRYDLETSKGPDAAAGGLSGARMYQYGRVAVYTR